MDSEDPEERIRQLEGGGIGQTPAPSAPPPFPQPPSAFPPPPTPYGTAPGAQFGIGSVPPFGTPFGAGSPTSFGTSFGTPYGTGPFGGGFRRRSRGPWLLVLVLGVGLPLAGVLVPLFIFFGHSSSFGHSSLSGLIPFSNGPTAVPQGGVLSVGGNDETDTIACNDGTLTLSGNDNKFTVTGHCHSLQVSGNDTHVTVDSADTIDAGGIDTVTIYHTGSPVITQSGINSTANQG